MAASNMLTRPQNLAADLQAVRDRITAAALTAGRDPVSVTLVGVSKTHPAAVVQAAIAAGLTDLGENYVQEAVAKIDGIADPRVTWHLIGPLQGNKTRDVAERFQWVHTVDREKIARRLSEQRPHHAPPLQVCLQVRLGGEESKSGVEPQELEALAGQVAVLPRLRLRGLMCIPPAEEDPARQRHWFAELRRLRDALNARGHALDVLSMGMSADFELAIAEGATHVRVGTAIFGPRP
ncbi:MAG: YggS family pyridoxal phosphate-dependent enzyme [Proteobacteria bacterium]|nr:YggS family pyridoxal phosphate-dependent enzyme [Pseudomonadota bacterium]